MATNAYEQLQLPPGANLEAVKQAYFTLVRRYGPESDQARFTTIRQAYELLSDQVSKAELDAGIFWNLAESFAFPEIEPQTASLVKINRELAELRAQSDQPAACLTTLKIRSLLLAGQGRFEPARADWDEISRLDPTVREAVTRNTFLSWHYAGWLAATREDYPAALEQWRTAREFGLEPLLVSHNLALAATRGGDAEAPALRQAVLELWKENARAGGRGALYWQTLIHIALQGSGSGAATDPAAGPGARRAQAEQADLQEWRQRAAELETRFRRSPEDSALARQLAQAWLTTGRESRAFALWEKLRRAQPDDPELLAEIITARLSAGKRMAERSLTAPALAHFKEVLRLEHENAAAHEALGEIYHRRGDYRAAVRHWEHSLAANPDNRALRNSLRAAQQQVRKG